LLMNMHGGKAKSKQQPKVFVGIPTGPPKLYATYFMVAALANLDYDNMEIHWACTAGYSNTEVWRDFYHRLKQLMTAVAWREGVSWHIHYKRLTKKQLATHYQPVLQNKTLLRDLFLDGDCEYFLLLGGDNPPPRNAIKRLLRTKADVAMGVCYQRPGVDKKSGVYPLVWRYLWLPWELDQLENIDPVNLEEMRLAWLQAPNIINISFDPNWKKKKNQWVVTGGDGCALIRRNVLEMIDWGITPEIAYHSEDIHFMTLALWHRFTTCVATDLHVAHMHVDGVTY
jgi:hypothetical protein